MKVWHNLALTNNSAARMHPHHMVTATVCLVDCLLLGHMSTENMDSTVLIARVAFMMHGRAHVLYVACSCCGTFQMMGGKRLVAGTLLPDNLC
jgi:hypothetical protein